MENNLLIKDALTVSFYSDGYNAVRVMEADILIEDGYIAKIDRNISSKAPVLHANGKMAIPGFVNGRSRLLASAVSAGFAEDRRMEKYEGTPLYTRVNPFINLALEVLSETELSALLETAVYRAVYGGTTTLFEHCVGPEMPVLLNLFERYGLRAFIAPMLMSRRKLPTADAWGVYNDEWQDIDEDAEISALEALIEKYRDHPLLTVCTGVGPAETLRESLMRKAARLAWRTNGISMMPLGETKHEIERCAERHGLRPAEIFHKTHLLTDRTLTGGHTYSSAEDIKVLKSARSRAVVCPYQAMLDAETAPFIEFLIADVPAIIGSGRCSPDMIRQMNMSAISGKLESHSRSQMRAQDAFFGATVGGGRALGLPLGELMDGRTGDVSLIDLQTPMLSPFAMPVSELVYNMSSAGITDVIAAGRIVKKDGSVVDIDVKSVSKNAQAAMEKVWCAARESGEL